MKTKLLKSMRVFLVAAGLCVGANDAWATVTQVWSADFSSAPSGMSYSVQRGNMGIDNGFLLYDCTNQNGIWTKAEFTDAKFNVSSAWKMEFDWEAESGNTSGSSATFVTNKGNAFTISWTNGAATATIADANSTSLATALPIVKYGGAATTISSLPTKITVVGDPNHGVYLTVTNGGTTYVDNILVTSAFGYPSAFNGNLGRYYSKMALDNIVFSTMDAPAFTLSATTATPTVGGKETVDVTGITGTISVSSSNTDIATATYTDGTITINGVADGVANITVTGTNDGLTTSQIIEATVGSVATTDVTVNYLCGGSAIASPTIIAGVTIGSSLALSDITYSNTVAGTGCRYVNPTFSVDFPYTVVEDGVINITYTKQDAVPSLNVYAKIADTNHLVKTYDLDGKYVGDAVTITYPTYFLDGETLYSTTQNAHGDGYYKWNYTLEGSSVEITYGTSEVTNVVFYKEAEAISGGTTVTGSNADIRCSGGAGARFDDAADVAELAGGIYTIYTQVWGGNNSDESKNIDFNFIVNGDVIHTNRTTGALHPANSSFTLPTTATISIAAAGDNSKMLDYVYIVKTGDLPANVTKNITAAGWATYFSPYILDFSTTIENLEAAYIVTGGADGVLTKTAVDGAVPANTGLLLKGDGEVSIPVAATATFDVTSNKLEGTVEGKKIDANAGYVLMASPSLGFYLNSNAFTLSANSAYLPAGFDGGTARAAFFSFGDDATGINAAQTAETGAKDYYNLNGQRVAQPSKGLYIIGGKKLMVK